MMKETEIIEKLSGSFVSWYHNNNNVNFFETLVNLRFYHLEVTSGIARSMRSRTSQMAAPKVSPLTKKAKGEGQQHTNKASLLQLHSRVHPRATRSWPPHCV